MIASNQKSENEKIRRCEDKNKKIGLLNFSTSQPLNFSLLLLTVYCLLFTVACGHMPPKLSDTHLRAIEFNQKAGSAFKKGDYKKALHLYSEALMINRSIENSDGIAINLINMAIVYRKLGEGDKAHKHIDELFNYSPFTIHHSLLSEAAFIKAMLYLDDVNYEYASQWVDRALSFCQNDRCSMEGKIYNLKGRIALLRGDPSSAITFGNKGLMLNKACEDREEIANSLRLLAGAKAMRGEYEEAMKSYRDALATDKSLGLSRKVAIDLIGIGNVLFKQGELEDALKYFKRALSVSEGAEDKQGIKDATIMIEKCLKDLEKK
ncbi:MAG: tetratricopeptide repeat protein [Nitrospirota bacterium]